MDDGDLNRSLNNLYDDAVDLDNDGNLNWELDNVRYFDNFLFQLLDFVDSRNIVIDGH